MAGITVLPPLAPESYTSPLDKVVLARHSTREFLPIPVPRSDLMAALALAQHAPSNSNIQPWNIIVVSGAANQRLKRALLEAANNHEAPKMPPLPPKFQQLRFELGATVYGSLGIERHDKAGRRAATLHNYDFYSAPTAAIVCMHRDLAAEESLSVGMYLQTLLLSLTEKGLDTCVEVAVAGYPEVLRQELGIDEEFNILCGVAIGYSDHTSPVNDLRSPRHLVDDNVKFIQD